MHDTHELHIALKDRLQRLTDKHGLRSTASSLLKALVDALVSPLASAFVVTGKLSTRLRFRVSAVMPDATAWPACIGGRRMTSTVCYRARLL